MYTDTGHDLSLCNNRFSWMSFFLVAGTLSFLSLGKRRATRLKGATGPGLSNLLGTFLNCCNMNSQKIFEIEIDLKYQILSQKTKFANFNHASGI